MPYCELKAGRRAFLGGSTALIGSGVLGSGTAAPQGENVLFRAGSLPARETYLIQGAYILTMDSTLGDLKSGDVLIQNGEIVQVAEKIEDRHGATLIDARDMIMLPGFVDTHTHFWSTQMRGNFGDTKDTTYFVTRNRLANAYEVDDMYLGTKLGAIELIYSGITTALDFCHNIRSRQAAEACIGALRETGIRARFLYGASTISKPAELIDLSHFEQLSKNWSTHADDSPLSLGLAWRGPLGTTAAVGDISPALDVARQEFEVARRLKLPISVHVSGRNAKRQFDSLAQGGFLSPDLQLVHFTDATQEDLKKAREAGASVSLTPLTELRVGYGMTQLDDYLKSGIAVGLGIDSNSLAGYSDMFGVMKLFQLIEAGRTRNELAITARRLLELATIEGAKSIGLAAVIGSITPGKRADIILISPNSVSMGRAMFHDPAHLLVEVVRPSDIDTVLIDGRLLKRDGRMTAAEVSDIVRQTKSSIDKISKRIK